MRCSLSAAKLNRKFLCRDECLKVLTETIDVRAHSGKYSIQYESSGSFSVTISQLTSSDSGRYRCGVGRQAAENTCQEFEVIVRDGELLLKTPGLTSELQGSSACDCECLLQASRCLWC